jgi:sigma-B regulation protein RsbU (phosphoserine phosphatase)
VKILIAEDDPISLRVLRMTLEGQGHEVVSTVNGAEAWRAFVVQPFEVVVSDWMMPEMDGVQLCQKIRERKRARSYCYFIMLTARTGRENHKIAMEAGVDDFLTKPMRPDELIIRLRVAQRILAFMKEVGELRRLLPICSYCKKVRDDKDYWQGIETYLHRQTGTDFSHSICPDCYTSQVKPQLAELEEQLAKEAAEAAATKPPSP